MAKSRKRKGKPAWLLGSICVIAGLLILVALASHTFADDDRIVGRIDDRLSPFEQNWDNQGGLAGSYFAYSLFTLLGWLAWFFPIGLFFVSLRLYMRSIADRLRFHLVLLFVICVAVTMMVNVQNVILQASTASYAGGIATKMLSQALVQLAGPTGTYLLLSGLVLVLILCYTSIVPLIASVITIPGAKLFRSLYSLVPRVFRWFVSLFKFGSHEDAGEDGARDEVEDTDSSGEEFEESHARERKAPISQPEKAQPSTRKAVLKRAPEAVQIKLFDYEYPSLSLLNSATGEEPTVSSDELTVTAKALKETLETFGLRVDGSIDKFPGPVITRYEFKPGVGIKVNQILGLADDLALALKAQRIRIIAPIPGKAAVGVEIPNRNQQSVFLREILDSDEFKDPRWKLPLALGKTTSGRPFVADLTKMPHLLVAGATGSGKSVCMNVLITSLMYRLHPMQVKFIFIDPKMLELSMYSGLPHLARPVVTKPKLAEKVLADAVVEMENRYRKLKDAMVRHIEDFNLRQKREEDKLPYIVICIDELADLMMSSQSTKTELLITRLAQMARAVGIHLVLATQRPSVDVITGLIKANFPARIAFQVSSKVDSRTILDANGAEKLLGMGDMLFLPSGQPEPIRIHGSYISSEETERVVDFIRKQNVSLQQTEQVTQESDEEAEVESSEEDGDPLFREACEVVIRHKQGSVSLLQRRLGIGYQRAARLIDKLEQAQVVSPYDGSKAREVLVDKSYLETFGASGQRKVGSESA